MHPQAEALAQAFISNFWSADHSIKWGGVEEEMSLTLNPNTILVGRVDAYGHTEDGDQFFGEWKTISPRANLVNEKVSWRFDPQALTYALFFPAGTRFTVRWAQKKNPPVCDFEWYTYNQKEIDFWRTELMYIANRIRELRQGGEPWPVNPTRCFKYGPRYVCPFFEEGCSKLRWRNAMGDMIPRESHLAVERFLLENNNLEPDTVILDATRVEEWLGCNERYRRQYEMGSPGGGQREPAGESLVIGTDFHSLLVQYYKSLMAK